MIKGQLVGLRAIERSDLPQLLAWRNQPELRRFFREYRELSSDNQLQWYEQHANNNHNTRMFAIQELSTGRLLGACGLCYIDWINRNADFSIYIGADDCYIDNRYAPDAAHVMMGYAFDELHLHRLWAEIYSFDQAKERFFQDLGFVLEGRHRQTHWTGGQWCDSLYFGCLATDLYKVKENK